MGFSEKGEIPYIEKNLKEFVVNCDWFQEITRCTQEAKSNLDGLKFGKTQNFLKTLALEQQ